MSLKTPMHGRDHRPEGSDPIPGLGTRLRAVYGQIANDADITDAGSGDWTVVGGLGTRFTITFATPFATPPTVLLTPNNFNADAASTPAAYFVEQSAVSTSTVEVVVYKLDGTEDNNGGFNFLAVAPA